MTPEHAVSSANSHGQPVTDASHGGIPASPGYQRIQKLKNMFLVCFLMKKEKSYF